MKSVEGGALSFTDLFNLPTAVDVRTAARALNISPAMAYRLINQNTFPCRVLHVGGIYRIATCELMRSLGIEEMPVYTTDSDTESDG
ncbi:helix-turn-helix domain-containing protein [Streptomyces liangshanensis]|uniref:Helix-turn-helix domain-containing protein n=1 Tax=Streptomyces liangshanensis TaxID=2717324 RepID=A0A6G9H3K9_9ACTN|nr:helix-turn-helix domain-containing protein [Streptomyces liangshanensis]QIQ05113.1 helix-turn-helix domain-containing protein [Streptomyces liangshanensis]